MKNEKKRWWKNPTTYRVVTIICSPGTGIMNLLDGELDILSFVICAMVIGIEIVDRKNKKDDMRILSVLIVISILLLLWSVLDLIFAVV